MTDLSSRFRAAVNLEQSEPSTMFFYARLIEDQLAAAVAKSGAGDLEAVLNGGETWTVE
jgi:hypothetical protein